MLKQCAYSGCQKWFDATRENQMYCSHRCAVKGYYERNKTRILSDIKFRNAHPELIVRRKKKAKEKPMRDKLVELADEKGLSYGIVRAFYPDMEMLDRLAKNKRVKEGNA